MVGRGPNEKIDQLADFFVFLFRYRHQFGERLVRYQHAMLFH